MVFCCSALIAESPVTQLFLVLLSVFVVSLIVGLVLRPRMTISIRPPAYAQCGQRVELPVWLRNDSRHRAYDVAIEMLRFRGGWRNRPQRYPIRNLAAGESTLGSVVLEPTRRGLLSWPSVEVVSNFPFNLFRFWKVERATGGLIVWPRFTRLEEFRLPSRLRTKGLSNDADQEAAGALLEYAGSREYQPGVPVRRWDYAAWARLSKPVVREFSSHNRPACGIIVDMCTTMAHPPKKCREACLSIAASIVDALSTRQFLIKWVTVGGDVVRLGGERDDRQRMAAMEVLALAEERKEDKLKRIKQSIEARSEQTDLIYFITANWDEARQHFSDDIAGSAGTVETIVVAQSDSATAVRDGVHFTTPANVHAGRLGFLSGN